MTTAEQIAQRIRIAESSGRQHITIPTATAWEILQALADKRRPNENSPKQKADH